jgi:hypothetical protein
MLVCQWHLDIVYGKQAEAVRIGPSASHLVDEYSFESLADFEAALAGMAAPQFRAHSDALAPLIVSGSQHWVVYRVLEQS